MSVSYNKKFRSINHTYPDSPIALFKSLWIHRFLIYVLAKRDILGRYRGSYIGVAWSFINPILLLSVYSFVFTSVFKARWDTYGGESIKHFAPVLFIGLIVHSFFSECLVRAPGLMQSNINYVKKIVFPLDALPWVTMISALFHASNSFLVYFIAQFMLGAPLPWTSILLPIIFAPLVFMTMGLAWLLVSLGVFVRDIGQIISFFMSILLFLSPIFYPVSSFPVRLQGFLIINPLTLIIEELRNILIYGHQPSWIALFKYYIISLTVSWIGFFVFQRVRKVFADVL